MIRKLYPNFKKKAVVLSYDDGVVFDERLISLLNKYHLKGTFNLNSKLMEDEYMWHTESGLEVKRLSLEKARHLYDGHEICSHSLTHPHMENMSYDEAFYEMHEDKLKLERFFNREVYGYATPFTFFDEKVRNCAINSGFYYVRVSRESYNFSNFYERYSFSPTIFHFSETFDQIITDFIKCENELAYLVIVGHSYDLEEMNMWDKMENYYKLFSESGDIASLTNYELIKYHEAIDKMVIESDRIINNSDINIFISVDENLIEIGPHEEYFKIF